jgi:segregation and condensation protein B
MLSLAAQIEALLFTITEPITTAQVAKACQVTTTQAEHELRHLEAQLSARGLMLQQTAGKWQLVSRPEAAEVIERHHPALDAKPAELSKAALETLAVVVFRGPVSQSQIEAVRGVASDQSLRTLLGKGLIQEVTKPGEAPHYAASHALLQELGVGHTGQLRETHED